jgi:glycerol uptake facilitator-like aquaporin
MLVWIGCGTAVSSQAIHGFNSEDTNDNSFLTAVALAFGIGISVLVYTIAPISGGHINPAVTFGFVLLGDLSPMLWMFLHVGPVSRCDSGCRCFVGIDGL